MYYFIRMGPYVTWWYYPNLMISGLMELPLTFMWYRIMRDDTDFWHWGGSLCAAKTLDVEALKDDEAHEHEDGGVDADEAAEAEAEVQARIAQSRAPSATSSDPKRGTTAGWDSVDAILNSTSKLLTQFGTPSLSTDSFSFQTPSSEPKLETSQSSPEKLRSQSATKLAQCEEELYDALLFGVTPTLCLAVGDDDNGSHTTSISQLKLFAEMADSAAHPRTASSIIGPWARQFWTLPPGVIPNAVNKIDVEVLDQPEQLLKTHKTDSFASNSVTEKSESNTGSTVVPSIDETLSNSQSMGSPPSLSVPSFSSGSSLSESASDSATISNLALVLGAMDSYRKASTRIAPAAGASVDGTYHLDTPSPASEAPLPSAKLYLHPAAAHSSFSFYSPPHVEEVSALATRLLQASRQLPLVATQVASADAQFERVKDPDVKLAETQELETRVAKPGTQPLTTIRVDGQKASTRRRPNTGERKTRADSSVSDDTPYFQFDEDEAARVETQSVLPSLSAGSSLSSSIQNSEVTLSTQSESQSRRVRATRQSGTPKLYRSNVLNRLELGLLADAPDAVVQEGVQIMIEANRRHLVHFGHITILEDESGQEVLLGAGTYSRVFLGVYKCRTKVALKFFVKLVDLGPETVAAFARETAVHCSLRHPNIVRSYGLCVCPPALILITEFCSRGALWDCLEEQHSRALVLSKAASDLAQALTHRQNQLHAALKEQQLPKRLPTDGVLVSAVSSGLRQGLTPISRLFECGGTWSYIMRLRLALSAARGIEYLHSRGLLHRDIKSPNFLVSRRWRAKVSDFGLTRQLAQGTVESSDIASKVHTSAHMTAGVGTYMWMAPEVLAQHSDYGFEADIFSLGGVLAEIFTGFNFDGERIDALAVEAAFEESALQRKQAFAQIYKLIEAYEQNASLYNVSPNGELWEGFDRTTGKGIELLIRIQCGLNPVVPAPLQALVLKCLDGDRRNRPTASQIVQSLFTLYLQALVQ